MRFFLFSAMKDEAPFILEWLAYHKAIGFTDIVIAANKSNDNTIEMLTALQEAGEISLYETKVLLRQKPQGVAANRFNDEKPFQNDDWAIWLDADEFLNIHLGDGKLDDLVDRLETEHQVDGMFIPWRLFGDNGLNNLPKGFVTEAQIMACTKNSTRAWKEIKTFFKVSDKLNSFCYSMTNRPRVSPQDTPPRMLLGTGKPYSPAKPRNAPWVAGEDYRGASRHEGDGYAWTYAQINHYIVRTPELFKLKKVRGRGAGKLRADGANGRHTEEFYRTSNCNDVEDKSILRHSDALRAEYNRLLALPGIKKLHDEACEITRRRIAELT